MGKNSSPAKKRNTPIATMCCWQKSLNRSKKKPFLAIIADRIFKPCQLLQTYYGNKPDSVTDEALSYIRPPRWQRVPTNDLNDSGGAGAVVTTPTELNLFIHQLFSGRLLSSAALQQMTTLEAGYGCGLMQNYFKDKMAYSHSGSVDGFQATFLYFPKENFSLAYVSNGTKLPLNALLILVLEVYFGGKG